MVGLYTGGLYSGGGAYSRTFTVGLRLDIFLEFLIFFILHVCGRFLQFTIFTFLHMTCLTVFLIMPPGP